MSAPEYEVDAAAHAVEFAAPPKKKFPLVDGDKEEEGWDTSDDEGGTYLDGVLSGVAGTLAGAQTEDVKPIMDSIGADVTTLTGRVDQVEGEVNMLKSTITQRSNEPRAPDNSIGDSNGVEDDTPPAAAIPVEKSAPAPPEVETKEAIPQGKKPTVDELVDEMAKYLTF